MRELLIRFGLRFESDDDERRFGEGYLLRTVRESQLFLVVSALFIYTFFVWDRLIDPVHADTTQVIRGLIIAPLVLLAAGILQTSFGKRHFELVILGMLTVVQLGLASVYFVLDRGYEYAALAFTMGLLGTGRVPPARRLRHCPSGRCRGRGWALRQIGRAHV